VSNKDIIDESISLEIIDNESIPFASQVSQTVRAGLPLESGIRALAEQTASGRTRRALLELSDKLEQGIPLVDAMAESQARLPRSMSALVEAGMETGRLDTVMQYSVEQSQRAGWLRQQIWMSMAYPIFLLWFASDICAFVLITIIPQFKNIFNDFGTELPGLTLALVGLSDAALTVGWWPILLFMPLLGLAWIPFLALGRTRLGRRWSTSIPLLGSVFRLATLSDFCQILAILMESNLPFPKALRFAAHASDDYWLGRKCTLVAHAMEEGATPDEAAMLAGMPNSLTQVFRHASSDRTVVEALRGLADLYAARCSVSSRLVGSLFEPFAVILVVGFAGLTAIAVFMPLIKLLNDLS
jgi:type II secretory pathway component PulF